MRASIAEKIHLGYHKTMKRLLIIILFIVIALPAYSMETDGKECLKKGKEQLENKKYEDAVASLSRAAKENPLLGDYALLWLSDAYHETGNHKESLQAIHTLLNNYPDSPLEKKARLREIKESEETSGDNIQQLFESYTRDYKGDQEVKYLYARWLTKNNKTDQAKKIFKELYIGAGPFSGMSYGELTPSDISVDDLVRRACKPYECNGLQSRRICFEVSACKRFRGYEARYPEASRPLSFQTKKVFRGCRGLQPGKGKILGNAFPLPCR